MKAERELRAEVDIEATPERVWSVVTDFARMAHWSPELVKMLPLKPGGLRVGQWYLGINRRKSVLWPTRSVVATVDPGRTIAWDTKSSGARWIYELTPTNGGTHLAQRRPVPDKLTSLGKEFTRSFLGGTEGHADELEEGMRRTLEQIKAAAEA